MFWRSKGVTDVVRFEVGTYSDVPRIDHKGSDWFVSGSQDHRGSL